MKLTFVHSALFRALIALAVVFAIGCGSVVSPPETDADSATMDATLDVVIADASATSDAVSADSADAAACSVLGDWNATTGLLDRASFRFRANGTWQGATGGEPLGGPSAIELGNFAQGANIVVTNDPGASGCAITDRGEYQLNFDASCSQMTWTLSSDTCMGRATVLNGATFSRM